ncbi:SRPBCC family protein [Arachidicoccus sp.]|uniref:SRPBCC family protein n=1 Tax=Arachidicoccus sp. TaxID=1872624 RepID=UPI003D199802
MKRKLMTVVYILIAIIGLVLIAALFTKKDYTIKREITINQPDSIVYDYLRFFKNHKTFNAWFLKDPNMKETAKGNDGQIGFVLSYEGNKDLGSGEQELIGLEPNKKIDIELRFIKPFKSVSQTPYELQPVSANQTKVVWTMNGKMNYPLNIALLFINMDNFLGKDIQKSLENLKVNLEK